MEEALASAYVYGNGDRFASYYTTEDWLQHMADSSGSSVGIGVYVTNDPTSGLHIVQTMKDSPAQKAGLKIGDIITKVEGEAVRTVYDVMDIVNEHNPGDSITVEFYRGGQYHTTSILLGSE